MPLDPILIDLPPFLDGPRIHARPYQSGDGPALFEAVNENLSHLLPYMVWASAHRTREDSELVVRRCRARWETREDLTLSIWERESGRFLGGSGLHRIQWDIPSFEIGYWVRASEQGKGYITETVELLMELAFMGLGANRLFLRVVPENTRSMAIPQRLGFVREGTLRNATVDADGRLRDLVMFSMTPQEYRARPNWIASSPVG